MLVVEELTQINVQLWCDIALARLRGVQIIAVGDFGQFQAVAESWAGSPVAEGALQHSQMLAEACPQVLILTENYRSDPPLFDFYTGLRCGQPDARDLADALAEARLLFPVARADADYTLTMSHNRRVQVNAWRNRNLAPEGAVMLRAPPATRAGNRPQDMWVWPGLQLIGAGGKRSKGLLVTVTSGFAYTIELSNGASPSHKAAVRCLRLTHALCYAAVQRLTLPGRVRGRQPALYAKAPMRGEQ